LPLKERDTVSLEIIQLQYAYNAWANRRVLDTAAQLSLAQLKEKSSASFESIFDTLVHTMSAQWIWLSRWQGTSPQTMIDPHDFADLTAVRERWAVIEQETQAFVAQLDEATFMQTEVVYTNTKGKTFSYPLWQLMLHQVNHATQHRSEIAAIMTQLDHSPGWLDLIMFLNLQKEDQQ
jgi:uncharacterized damage-inducible protein DinB